jgi:hypothetical protein
MPIYVAILSAALALYFVAAKLRWQSRHEDYRAVNEVLHVQDMWWRAGLSGPIHRADHYYLPVVEQPFANLRSLAATIITWVRIIATSPIENWRAIHGGLEMAPHGHGKSVASES